MTIKSPCTDICQFDRKSEVCVGCFRTTEEIRSWRKFTEHKRQRILSDVPRRRAKVQARRRAD
ncbi:MULTISPECIES: DUF1289 domain-containing protein [Xanthomonas]|uniref:DUF1289 domain-containing protein n=1 Tax=Xanthomonas euvesicatoria TaxID=456327 RepID=A0AAX4FQD0_XANEU|nr:DUF1289 domain-containing protein [Xanthomonas euvesicatoria]NCT69788.1 DUF1289 domain-containing protein [Xanthomonadaceae bacterium]WOP46281.1 DUF1289 domain-containing protein [Xanthomonas euvesicatoria]WOP50533.1 DUF1289 domain-containing protein [Xanthomonas euvesicatoria]WOP54708.1 DUF1289 domain-containing protein [Xanthomonas euvesicatoria]WOP58790.1 DUF1289 domain-containing protein [Xanthomonas euvesicatoria]